jgi:hypothetical protein
MPAEQSRKYLAEIAFAFCAVALISTIWVSSDLMLNRPMQADYATGLVYAFSVKGPKVYVSASDINRVSLCWMSCILAFGGIAYAVGPASRSDDITLRNKQSIGIAFLISGVIVAGSFLLFGRWIGDFLSAHGVVLHFL